MNMISSILAQATSNAENPSVFIEAMAAAVTPVSIVTSDGPAGRFGMTVSAVSSVSAEPPMVLACLNRRSPAVAAILENAVFCINMLCVDQHRLANCFAGRPEAGEPFDFDTASWCEGVSGAPVLQGAVASFDCRLENTTHAGTHIIVIGRVLKALSTHHQPLAFKCQNYQAVKSLQPEPSRGK